MTQSSQSYRDVPCPFCGLVCDDLALSVTDQTISPTNIDCPLASEGYRQAAANRETQARLKGQPADRDQALDRAAELLATAQLPLFAGLATDVNGMRAALRLAERCRGVIDHGLSAAQFAHLEPIQQYGWVTTTLTEARNRADLVIIVGDDIEQRMPRFVERILAPEDRLFARQRRVVLIGPSEPGKALKALDPLVIPTPMDKLGETIALLRALLYSDLPIEAPKALQTLTGYLDEADYAVITWPMQDFGFKNAELTLDQMLALVRELNQTRRAALLPVGGRLGSETFNRVCGWHTGFPGRVSFGRNRPDYQPHANDHRQLIGRGEADLLVWIAGFTPELTPPETDIPTIVLGHPALSVPDTTAVYLPTAIPGVDHPGQMFRGDSVVALSLKQLRNNDLPSAAVLLDALARRLDKELS